MIISPPFLQPGDIAGIVAPAYKIDPAYLIEAKKLLSSWGLKVQLASNLNSRFSQFSGDDKERLNALQEVLDNPDVKCIFCARGGYGTSRIIDRINLAAFKQNPKWLIGFSDITILLSRIFLENIAVIHGPMPLNFNEKNSARSMAILKGFLFDGIYPEIRFKSNSPNKTGTTKGLLVGGNLSMLIHSIGTSTEVNMEEKILFIEDTDEKLYKIDRMIIHLKRAGVLDRLKGLIIGHFSGTENSDIFGQNLNEIILTNTEKYDFPICFNAPVGHIMPNFPMIIGKKIQLNVMDHEASIVLKN